MAPAKGKLHHIIVVGGGAGGLELATQLGHKLGRKGKAEITLVDKARTHVWKPLLHEIAAGSMDVERHALEYQAQGWWHGFKYRYGEMTGIDRKGKRVHLAATHDEDGREITPDRWFDYDTLVIAVGSVSNDFGTPGVKENAIMLDTPEEAERFNRRLLNAIVRANAQAGPVRPGQLHVAIIGAGATGTELSAELHGTTRGLVAFGLDKINPEKDIRIALIEAAPRILPALPERLSTATATVLKDLGVEVKSGCRVMSVTPEGVNLQSGEFFPTELVVWAAGVKGADVLASLDGLEVSRLNTLVVKPTLQTTRDDDIFVIGDAAYLVADGETAPIAPRAQAAHQEVIASRQATAAQVARRAVTGVQISRLRLARLARALFDGRQSHGFRLGQVDAHRGLVRQDDVPLALQDARDGAAWPRQSDAGHDLAPHHASHRTEGEAALGDAL